MERGKGRMISDLRFAICDIRFEWWYVRSIANHKPSIVNRKSPATQFGFHL